MEYITVTVSLMGTTPPSLTKKNYCITAEIGSFDKSAGRCFIELKKLEADENEETTQGLF